MVRVSTKAQTISRKPTIAKANAADLLGSSTIRISDDTNDSGIKILIGTARLRIAVCPISRKVCGLNAVMLRLNVNQVPQKTPITKANKMIVENSGSFSFILWLLRELYGHPTCGAGASMEIGRASW